MSEEILNYLENDKNYSVDCNDGSYYLELPYREAHEIKDLITNLQQENKQLKSILTELEEWCKSKIDEVKYNEFDDVLDKIQDLKEKYK